MGGVCSAGTTTIQDAREEVETEFLGIPGSPSSGNGFGKQKEASSSRPGRDESRKPLQKYDAGDSCKLKSPSPAKKGQSKIAEKSAYYRKERVLSLKQAAKVLDTIGKSIPGLSKEFVYGLVSRGNKISILAFEVANTIVNGANLLKSLSEDNIRFLKEMLQSEGIQRLVSGDVKELLMIAASDKREEFDVFLREVVRFGDLCKDSQWHKLGLYFSKLASGDSNPAPSKEEAEETIGELSLLARYTSELYHELNNLDRFEQDYKIKLEEAEYLDLHETEDLRMLHDELKHQRKLVKSLKMKSLWSRNMEEIMAKFVPIAAYMHQTFREAFGCNGITLDSSDAAEKRKNAQRLGPTGLAQHYANIIVQIDTIASRPACLPTNVRDSLYHALPRGVKRALCSRLQAVSSNEEFTISRVKAEMDKTSRWLVPFATNTIKAHQKFGWVGDWANAGKESAKSTSSGEEPIRLQTLDHADKEKTDLYILELVVWLHHLITLVKQRVHSIRTLPDGSPSHRKCPKVRSKLQQFPPMDYSSVKSNLPKSTEDKLLQQDMNLLEEAVCWRRSVLGRSKSQESTVPKRSGKVCPLSRSTGCSPSREMGERPATEHPSNDDLDLNNVLNESLKLS